MIKPKIVLTALHKSMLFISLILLLISFTQTAIHLPGYIPSGGNSDNSDFEGWFLFFFGWLGLFFNTSWQTMIIWLANPLFILSLFLLLEGKTSSSVFSSIATLLALSYIWIGYCEETELQGVVKKGSAEPAYYFWLSSILLLTATALHFEYFTSSDK